jgi:hypothetical protein
LWAVIVFRVVITGTCELKFIQLKTESNQQQLTVNDDKNNSGDDNGNNNDDDNNNENNQQNSDSKLHTPLLKDKLFTRALRLLHVPSNFVSIKITNSISMYSNHIKLGTVEPIWLHALIQPTLASSCY